MSTPQYAKFSWINPLFGAELISGPSPQDLAEVEKLVSGKRNINLLQLASKSNCSPESLASSIRDLWRKQTIKIVGPVENGFRDSLCNALHEWGIKRIPFKPQPSYIIQRLCAIAYRTMQTKSADPMATFIANLNNMPAGNVFLSAEQSYVTRHNPAIGTFLITSAL